MSRSIFDSIKGLVKSEKSSRCATNDNVFIFIVSQDATKEVVRKAVSELFKVDVISVNMLNYKSSKVRFRGALGRRSGCKRAFVKLPPGQKIGGDNV